MAAFWALRGQIECCATTDEGAGAHPGCRKFGTSPTPLSVHASNNAKGPVRAPWLDYVRIYPRVGSGRLSTFAAAFWWENDAHGKQ
jgi:hypothetical protein